MSFYDDEFYEPEDLFTIKDKEGNSGAEISASIQFSPRVMDKACEQILKDYLERNFKPKVERICESFFRERFGDSRIEEVIKQEVERKLNEQYPDVVENKVNEFAEKIKNLSFDKTRGSSLHGNSIRGAAENKVNEYIEKELEAEVKKTKEWLEQFSRNYFANNLFRAMGMMDKMIPEAMGDKNKSDK